MYDGVQFMFPDYESHLQTVHGSVEDEEGKENQMVSCKNGDHLYGFIFSPFLLLNLLIASKYIL